MAVASISEDSFDTEVLAAGTPVVVDFWAEWCGPCRKVAPILEEISSEHNLPVGKLNIDGLSLKVPLFGDLIQKSSIARFSRTFGSLTRSGVPILTCLEIVRDTSGNQVIANAIDAAREEVQQGGMISVALLKENVFPMMAIQMMSIGEETGQLDGMLMKVADFYEDEVEQAVKALTSILEPVMIVVLGGMVGTILLAMYLPMFKVFEKLG